MYRFIKDKRDYIFMLPYETDILDTYGDEFHTHGAGSDINSGSVDSSPSNCMHYDRNKQNIYKKDGRSNFNDGSSTISLLDNDDFHQKGKRISEKF